MTEPPTARDPGLQPERTGLAWERTAVAMMVAGVLLARYAAEDAHPGIAVAGIAQTVAGAATLVWAGAHYRQLHDVVAVGSGVAHPLAAQLVGLATVAFTATALALAVVLVVAT